MSKKHGFLLVVARTWRSRSSGYPPSKPPLLATVPSYYYLIESSNFQLFLLASERRFQHTKECGIWIWYAKVMKGGSFLGRYFEIVSST